MAVELNELELFWSQCIKHKSNVGKMTVTINNKTWKNVNVNWWWMFFEKWKKDRPKKNYKNLKEIEKM